MLLISYATQPKPQRPKPAAFEDFDFPTAEEGTPQCVVFGDCWVEDWFVNGLGNYRQRAIKKGGGLFGGKQTVGYHYYFGVHAGISRGPVDEVVEIKVADRTVWKYNPNATDGPSLASINALQAWRDAGSRPPMPALAREAYEYEKEDQIEWPFQITESMSIQIKASKIFGGDKGEGGVAGQLDLMFGEPDQAINPRLAAMTGPLTPAYRGKFTAFFDGLVCSMNPYPKPWKYRVRRVLSGWQDGIVWYPEKAVIWLASNTIKAMNPAHILYEAHTNRQWGRGIPSSLMGASWAAAADTLYSEGFGMCIRWTRQAAVREFIDEIVNHIGADVKVDPTTGKFELLLIRDDYVVDELPLFDFDTGLLAIDDDESSATVVSANTVIVNYRDPITNTDGSVPVDNLASIHGAGSPQPQTLNYPGIPTPELAARIAQRELRARNTGVKRMRVRLDRRGHEILPGSVFRISAPEQGIEQIVLRAGRVEGGNRAAGTIVVDAVQDVFGLPSTSYVQIQPPTWTPPSTQPTPVTQRRVIELPYRELAVAMDAAALPEPAGYIATLAERPTSLSLDYIMQTRVGSNEYVDADEDEFCPTALLTDDMPPTNESYVATINSAIDFDSIEVGTAALCGGEWMRVVGFNPDGSSVTLARGCGDSVAAFHAAGTRIWFYASDYMATDATQYQDSDSVDVRLLSRAGSGVLPVSAADEDSIILDSRAIRPYPPGNLQINGNDYPENVSGELTITWATRNRVTQGDALIDADESSITAEAGATTRVHIYNGLTLVRAYTGITTTTQIYPVADCIADGFITSPRIIVDAQRDGFNSWQQHDVTVVQYGFGYQFGESFGGLEP